MEFVDKLRAKPVVQKIEKFFPAIAFLGGFGWDSVTLGMSIDDSDLVFLLAYYTGALIIVTLLSAQLEHPEGWTAERIKAAADAQAQKSTAKPSANKISNTKFGNAAKATASTVTNAASKLADRVGIEKTAIPQNAIVVEHRFLDREWSPIWKERLTWALQFLFGGMFSALVVCYFKSSGSIASFILVILLAILLVGNEFLKKHYESFGLNLALFCILGTMFMNFTIPHLVHSIGFIWFFLSTLLSFGICTIIWLISHRSKKVLIAPAILSVAFILSYLMNWVPPVPLVLKQQMACQNFDKSTYTCDVDAPDFLQKVGLKVPSVHRVDSNEIFYLSSVYAPAKLKAEIEYRWYREDPATGKYTLTDKISSSRMVVKGGRENGFRSYSKKKNIPAGRYRVETAYKNGAVIGASVFDVIKGNPEKGFVRDTLR